MSARAWSLVGLLLLAAVGGLSPHVMADGGDGGTNDSASEDGDEGDKPVSQDNGTDRRTDRSAYPQQDNASTPPNRSEGPSTSGTAELEQPAAVSSEGRESLPAFIGVSTFGILGAVGLVLWSRYVT